MGWKTFCRSLTALLWVGCASKFSGRIALDDTTSNFGEARINVVGLDNVFREVCLVDEYGEFQVNEDMPDGLYLVEAVLPGYALSSYKLKISERKRVVIRMKNVPKTGKYASPVSRELDMGRAAGTLSLMPPRL